MIFFYATDPTEVRKIYNIARGIDRNLMAKEEFKLKSWGPTFIATEADILNSVLN